MSILIKYLLLRMTEKLNLLSMQYLISKNQKHLQNFLKCLQFQWRCCAQLHNKHIKQSKSYQTLQGHSRTKTSKNLETVKGKQISMTRVPLKLRAQGKEHALDLEVNSNFLDDFAAGLKIQTHLSTHTSKRTFYTDLWPKCDVGRSNRCI